MSRQRFSKFERQAIWLAYDKKCVYTGEIIDLRDMQIDHVIPENINKEAFENLKKVIRLPSNFSIKGYENLLPCKPGINLLKKSILFDSGRIQFFLAIAISKKSKIENTVKKMNKCISEGQAIVSITGLLEKGIISSSQITDILQNFGEISSGSFNLIQALNFANKGEIFKVKKADLNEMKNFHIKMGLNPYINGVTLTNNADNKIFVKTCKEYFKAIKDGYYPLTSFAMEMVTYFKHQCGLINALSKASIPEISFISNPKKGVIDIDLMPFSLFQGYQEKIENPSTETYQDKVNDGRLIIKKISQNLLIVEDDCKGQRLIEVARADFDNNGIEDILLYEYNYVINGSYRSGGITILSRKSFDDYFEVIDPSFSFS